MPDENGPKYVGLADPFPKVVRERSAYVCQRPRGGKRNALNCKESEETGSVSIHRVMIRLKAMHAVLTELRLVSKASGESSVLEVCCRQ